MLRVGSEPSRRKSSAAWLSFRKEAVKSSGKTITAWYERMMLKKDYMIERMGEPTFRAWRLYLGGGAGTRSGDVNRIYCIAV